MDKLIEQFPNQLEQGLGLICEGPALPKLDDITNICIAGMGGSGIGANFIQRYVQDSSPIPIHVVKEYQIPAFVGPNTLCIVSSYSGNTEETLFCFGQMRKNNAQIVVVTAGGTLLAAAKDYGLTYIQLPTGWPAPRACLGFSFLAQVNILAKLGLAKDGWRDQVKIAIQRLRNEQEEIRGKASKLAMAFEEKLVVIYSTDQFSPVAQRFQQQLNENSKMLAWHQAIPEMNHNEVVGWHNSADFIAVLLIRDPQEHERNKIRMDFVEELVNRRAGSIVSLSAKGASWLEKCLYLIHLLDWCSYYLAANRRIDPMDIQVIDLLKRVLSEQALP